MEIKLWQNFSKKQKSTKQPSADSAITKTAVLKEPTSVESPTFTISGNDTSYTYAQAFGHYYFIQNIVQNTNGTSDIVCVQDELATFKTEIGNYTAFVVRSASNINNWLSDSAVSNSNEIVYSAITEGNTLSGYNINGSFAVRTLGRSGIKTYILSEATIQNVFNTYFDASAFTWTDVQDCLKNLFTSVAEPGQYIKSIKWFPFDISSTSEETAYFGFTATNNPAKIALKNITAGCNVTIPYHTGTTLYYGDWRDYDERFTHVTIFLPGFGSVPVDPKYLKNTMQVTYYIDIETGQCLIYLLSGGAIIGTFTGVAGVDVNMGGLSGTGAITGLSQIATSFSLNPLQFVGNAASGAVNAVTGSLSPTQSVCGNVGNRSNWVNEPYVRCSVAVMGTSEKPTTVEGGPCYKNLQINTLSGYVQTSGADVDMAAFSEDRDSVNSALDSGFYYE